MSAKPIIAIMYDFDKTLSTKDMQDFAFIPSLGMKADEVTVIGDSIDKDIIPAHRAGCNTVWIRGEQWTDDPVDESQANLAIDNLTELLDNNNIKYIY